MKIWQASTEDSQNVGESLHTCQVSVGYDQLLNILSGPEK